MLPRPPDALHGPQPGPGVPLSGVAVLGLRARRASASPGAPPRPPGRARARARVRPRAHCTPPERAPRKALAQSPRLQARRRSATRCSLARLRKASQARQRRGALRDRAPQLEPVVGHEREVVRARTAPASSRASWRHSSSPPWAPRLAPAAAARAGAVPRALWREPRGVESHARPSTSTHTAPPRRCGAARWRRREATFGPPRRAPAVRGAGGRGGIISGAPAAALRGTSPARRAPRRRRRVAGRRRRRRPPPPAPEHGHDADGVRARSVAGGERRVRQHLAQAPRARASRNARRARPPGGAPTRSSAGWAAAGVQRYEVRVVARRRARAAGVPARRAGARRREERRKRFSRTPRARGGGTATSPTRGQRAKPYGTGRRRRVGVSVGGPEQRQKAPQGWAAQLRPPAGIVGTGREHARRRTFVSVHRRRRPRAPPASAPQRPGAGRSPRRRRLAAPLASTVFPGAGRAERSGAPRSPPRPAAPRAAPHAGGAE